MMNYIWGGIMIISVVSGLVTGRISDVADAAMSGAADGISLFLTVAGMMILWSGLMKTAAAAGVTRAFAKLISPIIRFLFPEIDPEGDAAGAISMSMAANFLGLGSAATPMGLNAMSELYKLTPQNGAASNSMCMLVVLNTASIELIPTTVAAYRAAAGSASPLCILPCVWISSVLSVAVGVTAAKLLSKRVNPIRSDVKNRRDNAVFKTQYE